MSEAAVSPPLRRGSDELEWRLHTRISRLEDVFLSFFGVWRSLPPPRLVQTYFSPLMLRSLLSARLSPRALVARIGAPPRGSAALVASGLLVFAANGDVAHAAGSEVPAAKKRKEKVGTTDRKKVRGGAILIPLVSDPSIGYGEEEDPVHAWATALGPPKNEGGWTHQCVTNAITAVINVINARDEGGVKGFLKRVYRGPDMGKPKPLTHSDCEDLKSGFREALKPVFGVTCEPGYWKRHQAISAMHTKAVEAVNSQAVEVQGGRRPATPLSLTPSTLPRAVAVCARGVCHDHHVCCRVM